MGEMKESKLHHVMRVSWESEQMPGWEDSLSMVLGTIKKEFQMKSKDTAHKDKDAMFLEQDDFVL
ncbi:MAG: hypothetical protein IKY94_02050 [Lachnospiraceae bacterium]|nr:hypothetical protein [Lachnospiraceae bacterium]